MSKEITVTKRYLNLPVRNGATKRHMRLIVDGTAVRAFDIELAEDQPDFWVVADVAEFLGRRMAITVDDLPAMSAAWDAISPGDKLRGSEGLYREMYRPQFHFTARRGWHNDPNGLMYYQGEYHLFFQHNPYGREWGNMHWGHAISRDLVRWQELEEALYPDALGTCFSGSGVVDTGNTAGFQTGDDKPLVCIYTSAGGTSPESAGQPFTQSLAFSNDRGRSWTKYAGNPVLGHIVGHNRDPKVIWHAPTARWIMALYLDGCRYGLYASPDLKSWETLQELELPGDRECPDFFPLAVDGDPERILWVFWGASGTYLLGHFDGATFTPQGHARKYNWGGNSYAAQTWSDIPAADGRRIQIAWLRVRIPDMPFNQCMTFPCALTLRATPDGVRLCSEPVREIETLRARAHYWRDMALRPGENPLRDLEAELCDISAELAPGDAAQIAFTVRGIPITYDVATGELSCQGATAPLPTINGKVRLRVLVDHASIEIFGNDGAVALPLGVILDPQ